MALSGQTDRDGSLTTTLNMNVDVVVLLLVLTDDSIRSTMSYHVERRKTIKALLQIAVRLHAYSLKEIQVRIHPLLI